MTSSTLSTLRIASTAFAGNGLIPTMYTCDGLNVNPPLSISGVPDGTASLILIMEDPDAPTGIWDHWLVFNIDPKTTLIPEGSVPPGILGKGTNGKSAYNGPCPPDGLHRYIFTLYSLDIKLDLPEGATKNEIINAMNGHVLDHTALIGKYERQQEQST